MSIEEAKKEEEKEGKIVKEDVLACLNADSVIVGATKTSRCYELRKHLEKQYRQSSFATEGEPPGDKEHLGRTRDVGGHEIFVGKNRLWIGSDEWVYPVDLE